MPNNTFRVRQVWIAASLTLRWPPRVPLGGAYPLHVGINSDRQRSALFQAVILRRTVRGLMLRRGPTTHTTQLSRWIYTMNPSRELRNMAPFRAASGWDHQEADFRYVGMRRCLGEICTGKASGSSRGCLPRVGTGRHRQCKKAASSPRQASFKLRAVYLSGTGTAARPAPVGQSGRSGHPIDPAREASTPSRSPSLAAPPDR